MDINFDSVHSTTEIQQVNLLFAKSSIMEGVDTQLFKCSVELSLQCLKSEQEQERVEKLDDTCFIKYFFRHQNNPEKEH